MLLTNRSPGLAGCKECEHMRRTSGPDRTTPGGCTLRNGQQAWLQDEWTPFNTDFTESKGLLHFMSLQQGVSHAGYTNRLISRSC